MSIQTDKDGASPITGEETNPAEVSRPTRPRVGSVIEQLLLDQLNSSNFQLNETVKGLENWSNGYQEQSDLVHRLSEQVSSLSEQLTQSAKRQNELAQQLEKFESLTQALASQTEASALQVQQLCNWQEPLQHQIDQLSARLESLIQEEFPELLESELKQALSNMQNGLLDSFHTSLLALANGTLNELITEIEDSR